MYRLGLLTRRINQVEVVVWIVHFLGCFRKFALLVVLFSNRDCGISTSLLFESSSVRIESQISKVFAHEKLLEEYLSVEVRVLQFMQGVHHPLMLLVLFLEVD